MLIAWLFSNEDLLRELYCALEGITLPPDTPVTINTLSDALFMDRINDISFEINGKLVVLIEHQSTMNPNIPLRMLMYITRIYEKIIKARELEKELGDRTKAIKRAVIYCRDHDILKEFLEKYGTEVLKMLTKEWNQEDALAVRFDEGREEGIETGVDKGEGNMWGSYRSFHRELI